MTKNEIIAKVKTTRLESIVYYSINGITSRQWNTKIVDTLTEVLEDNKNYSIDFADVYFHKVYRSYERIIIKG